MEKIIIILHLYARDMNIYGDEGNVLALQRRLQWHGYTPQVVRYNPGDELPADVDIVIGGGGQDSGQTKIADDLYALRSKLRALADDGVPMLMVCGLYQLFGTGFKTAAGKLIPGIGLFDANTAAGLERLTGNVTIETPDFGTIIGYENHSGLTTLGPSTVPFGSVRRGAGNNGKDHTEYGFCILFIILRAVVQRPRRCGTI